MAGFVQGRRWWVETLGPTLKFPSDGWRFMGRPNRKDTGSALNDRTPAAPDVPLEEGQVIWGGPSNFDFGQKEDFSSGPRIRFSSKRREEDDEEDHTLDPIIIEKQEVARKEKTVRINGNVEGAWVDVAVITELVVQCPDDPMTGLPVYEHTVFKEPEEEA